MEIPFINQINWVDVVILVFLGRGFFLGFARGSTWGILRVFGAILVTFTAFSKSYPLALWTYENLGIQSPFLEWVFFILLGVVFGTLVNLGIEVITRIGGLGAGGFLNRGLGLVMGGVQACIFSSLILVMMVLSTSSYMDASVKNRSLMGPRILSIAPVLFTVLDSWVPGEDALSPSAKERLPKS